MWFQLRQWIARKQVAIRNIPFNIHLTLLTWYYGRGKIPTDKLPRILSGDPSEAEVFRQVVVGSAYLNAILNHYKVGISDSIAAGAFGRYIRVQSLDGDEVEAIRTILEDEHPALKMYEFVQMCGDISEAKLKYFGPPPPFETMRGWLLSLEK